MKGLFPFIRVKKEHRSLRADEISAFYKVCAGVRPRGNIKHFCFVFSILLLGIFFSMSFVSALSGVVHVPEKYTDVAAGERFYFEIEIKYPENPSRKDLRLIYEIVDVDNNPIAQSKVLKAVETQASFLDFIVIPESASKGIHIIRVKIQDYESLNEEIEASFHITSGAGDQIKIYFFILIGLVVLVGILVVVSFFLRRKK